MYYICMMYYICKQNEVQILKMINYEFVHIYLNAMGLKRSPP